MATGSGKTVVMAMLIAWHVLNKLANPQDDRFSDTFLIITPGITIRDRLRVLLPNDPGNYYRQRDVVSPQLMQELGKAKIIITNYHAFMLKEKGDAARLTKALLERGETRAFQESPGQMVRRVCRDFGNKKNVVIINDEAHHCYRRKPDTDLEELKGDEKREAAKRDEKARVWISGIEAVKSKIGVKVIYDLSATPFFLRGSGYPEGTLFPWVVSDFSLIDAIESGIVKVPRVPVADDSMMGDLPTYRSIWLRIREHLPKKGRGTEAVQGEPKLPVELEGALHSLYENYVKYYQKWENNADARAKGITPPVFIVVCNNTNVSSLVYRYIAGYDKQIGDRMVAQAGELPIFRNDDGNGNWLHRPNTILVDSEELDSGEAISPEFKKLVAREIEEFKHEYEVRFTGRSAEKLTDADILREVMNTVGKPGKLGEQVKCVVSVSMLTEGWDANTVSHILGVRAFGTQLLCEQVVGRALRRISYAVNENGMYDPEYAEVYGVPFSFIPCSGSAKDPQPGPIPTRVRALDDRIACEITFPRLLGYRYEVSTERLSHTFTDDCKMSLTTADVPTRTENAPIVGETSIHMLEHMKRMRLNQVAFSLAARTLRKYFVDDEGGLKAWLFPQLLEISKSWITECLTCKGDTFIQLLFFIENLDNAADKVYLSIVGADSGPLRLKPVLRPYDTVGSSKWVDFDTIKPTYLTDPAKCHVSHVVADTESWEQKMAQVLEEMPQVVHYIKNQSLGFSIPYSIDGDERQYIPDFIVHFDDGHGPDDLLNLIVEVTGEKKKDKMAKVATAKNLWVPAVNNHGGFGRWAFIEIADPWDAKNMIMAALQVTR
jgi:type III restriction enzyme